MLPVGLIVMAAIILLMAASFSARNARSAEFWANAPTAKEKAKAKVRAVRSRRVLEDVKDFGNRKGMRPPQGRIVSAARRTLDLASPGRLSQNRALFYKRTYIVVEPISLRSQ